MKQETLFTLDTPYRQSFNIEGFRFGRGEKCCAIVGAIRGNEIQQMYTCSLLIRELKRLEQQGAIKNEILVIPCVNQFSMNVGSRFWAMDNTDINRMFPGYDRGETTQRIADAVFPPFRTIPMAFSSPVSMYKASLFLMSVSCIPDMKTRALRIFSVCRMY